MNSNFHWQYYIVLEQDVESLTRYIEFTPDNFTTYSLELTKLLLSICSEVDVTMKLLTSMLSPNKKTRNINDYKEIITAECPGIIQESATTRSYNLEFHPWVSWAEDDNPTWWKGHTDVKHKRHQFYAKANLENVLEALSALFIVNQFLALIEYKKSDQYEVWPFK